MEPKKYKTKIRSLCRKAGTYAPEHDLAITKLAEILSDLDDAKDQYEEAGRNPVIHYTNKAGAENIVKNPLLMLIIDLRTQAIAYMRELGLTPSSLRKIKLTAGEQKNDNIATLLSLADDA